MHNDPVYLLEQLFHWLVPGLLAHTKRTGGYTIESVRVEPSEKSLRIFVKQTSPPPGALTIQALTAPFHFIAVPKSDLKAEFVDAK